MTKYFWYLSRNMPRADVIYSKKNHIVYGYIEEPDYEFIEEHDLRFFDYGTLIKVVGELD